MSVRPFFNIILAILVISGFFFYAPGCRKDHSYEGGNRPVYPVDPDPPLPADSGKNKIPFFCIDCVGHDKIEMGRWSFKIDSSLFCGTVTAAPITPDRIGFTFFGPSACSLDSGLIMTVYLPAGSPLTTDRNNLTTNRVAIEYYDNKTNFDVIYSRTIYEMTLTIESYVHQTRIASGRFSGIAYKANNETVPITSGKFQFKFP